MLIDKQQREYEYEGRRRNDSKLMAVPVEAVLYYLL